MDKIDEIMKANSSFFAGLDKKEARKKYRVYARSVHPDMVASSLGDVDQASRAFVKLEQLWSTYQVNLNSSGTTSSVTSFRIPTRSHEFLVDNRSTFGPFVKFDATYDDGHKNAMVMITKNPRDNDLMDAHVQAVRALKKDVPEEYRAFYPDMIDFFRVMQAGGRHHGVVHAPQPETFYTIEDILKRYPGGLDGRQIGWIWRRVLVAIGNAHDVGIINGSITPDNVWISPELHGVIIPLWAYSVKKGTPQISAVNSKYKDMYPSRVLRNKELVKGDDIAMSASCMLKLFKHNDEPRILRFLERCVTDARSRNAADWLALFTHELGEVYGPPRFATFSM